MKSIYFTLLSLLISYHALAIDYIGTRPMVLYGDIRRFDEIVNLTPASNSNKLELDNHENGLEVIATKKIYASAGVLNNLSQAVTANTFAWGSLGLFPVIESYARFYKVFQNPVERKDYKFTIPDQASALDQWTTGQAAFYNALGGLSMFLYTGISQLGIGSQVVIEGGYSIYIEKKENEKVYLELQRVSTKGITALTGTFISYAELGTLAEKSKGHAYEIDLKVAEQREALNDLLQRGLLVKLQQLDSTHAQIIGNISITKKQNHKKIALSTPIIPILDFSRTSHVQTIEIDRENIWGAVEDITIAEKSFDRSNRAFKFKKDFSRAAIITRDNQSEKLSIELNWNSKTSMGKLARVKKIFKRFVKDTKQDWVESISLENISKENLGYFELNLDYSLSDEAVTKLSQNKKLKTLAKEMANIWKKDQFASALKILKTCGGKLSVTLRGERISKITKQASFAHSTACVL
jgi:hypothetical protein